MKSDRPKLYRGVSGLIGRAVDSVLVALMPTMALHRRIARAKLAWHDSVRLGYEGGKITRTQPRSPTGSADKHIAENGAELRNSARTLDRDDAHCGSAIDTMEENVVGLGVTPQAACTPEETGMSQEECDALHQAMNAEWTRWSQDVADISGHDSFYDLQGLAFRTMVVDGECIAHAVIEGGEIRCEMIDVDRLANPGLGQDTKTLRDGVEVDGLMRPVRYWWRDNHPDSGLGDATDFSRPKSYPANAGGYSIVQHVFHRRRPGQLRGVSWLARAVGRVRQLHHYIDSELIAARTSSNYSMWIRKQISADDADLSRGDAEDGSGQQFHEYLEPGIIGYLGDGEEPFAFNPNRPGSQFPMFVELLLRSAAASLGMSYEMLAKDFGRMNLSSARALLRECRRAFDRQRRKFVRLFCVPWWKNVMRTAVAEGRIKVPARFLSNPEPFMRAKWVPSAYGVVDPVTDVEGSAAMVANNLSTPQEEAATFGRDSIEIAIARAKHLSRLREIEKQYGLDPGVLDAPKPSGQAAPQDMNKPEPTDKGAAAA